jgi:nitrogen fixation protein
VSGVLADPQLKLFNVTGTQVNQNDDWGGSTALANAFVAVNDFALPANSKDAALLVTLPSGGYSAQVNGAGTSTGVAMIEAYEADTSTPGARFTALSARNQVGTSDNIIIAGFVVTGNAPKTLLIRGIGPTLANYGVGGVLADPKLDLYSGNTRIDGNDNWGGTTTLSNAFTATQAFPLPANSKDAALLVTLQPGLYSAQVSGVGGTTGVALVEVYEMP